MARPKRVDGGDPSPQNAQRRRPAATEPRRPGKRDRTRAALIGAAAAVIGEKGYDRTTLEEVAARAGMSRGAIYANFNDRRSSVNDEARSRFALSGPRRSNATIPADYFWLLSGSSLRIAVGCE
jgi:AcrR family transcriptional regulator